MLDAPALKQRFWDTVNHLVETREVTIVAAEQIRELVTEMQAINPVPEPMNHQDKVEGHWTGGFAHYGSAHSRGKLLPAMSTLKTHTFGNLPAVPVLHIDGSQEIKVEDRSYNNVSRLENEAGTVQANCIVYGRYHADDDNPQRFHVRFYRYALVGLNGESDDHLREAFGLDADVLLDGEYKPPRLHSDVVYLDEDTRVNYGGNGGVYVMKLEPGHPGDSVSFT